jgi:putative tryptophan/tyrosine transport system substrate-binding protein
MWTMPTRRSTCVTLAALAAGVPQVRAQQGKVWRIGILTTNPSTFMAIRVDALRAALRERGYVEGRNLVVDFRSAEGRDDRIAELATELVRLNPDLIVTHALVPPVLKKITTTIPVVITDTVDPVGMGIAESLARPGGNFTGQVFFGAEIAAKRIDLLKDAMPRLSHIGLLYVDSRIIDTRPKSIADRAALLKLRATEFAVQPGTTDYAQVFAAMARQQVQAVVFADHPTLASAPEAIAQQGLRHRIATAGGPLFAEVGGFLGYGVRFPELWASAAGFVDRIFKGAKPADMAIAQPTKFHTVLNQKVAREIGVEVPRAFLAGADLVIE